MPHNVNASHPDIFRKAGVHASDRSTLWTGPAYTHRSGGGQHQLTAGAALAAPTTYVQRHGARLKGFELQNRSGSTISAGIGFKFANIFWKAGRYDGTTYTDITDDAQRPTAVAVQVTGADQTGFVILSPTKFDFVTADFTTAETNAGGVTIVDHVVRYSNDAASQGWITVATTSVFLDDFTTADAVWSATAHTFIWNAPSDWGQVRSLQSGAPTLTGLPAGYYALHFQSAQREASDVAAVTTGIEVGRMWAIESLTTNSIWEEETFNSWVPEADALVAYFGTADAGNRVQATVEAM